jgi:tetrahydromethanopterin S-methyltransferase subunit B
MCLAICGCGDIFTDPSAPVTPFDQVHEIVDGAVITKEIWDAVLVELKKGTKVSGESKEDDTLLCCFKTEVSTAVAGINTGVGLLSRVAAYLSSRQWDVIEEGAASASTPAAQGKTEVEKEEELAKKRCEAIVGVIDFMVHRYCMDDEDDVSKAASSYDGWANIDNKFQEIQRSYKEVGSGITDKHWSNLCQWLDDKTNGIAQAQPDAQAQCAAWSRILHMVDKTSTYSSWLGMSYDRQVLKMINANEEEVRISLMYEWCVQNGYKICNLLFQAHGRVNDVMINKGKEGLKWVADIAIPTAWLFFGQKIYWMCQQAGIEVDPTDSNRQGVWLKSKITAYCSRLVWPITALLRMSGWMYSCSWITGRVKIAGAMCVVLGTVALPYKIGGLFWDVVFMTTSGVVSCASSITWWLLSFIGGMTFNAMPQKIQTPLLSFGSMFQIMKSKGPGTTVSQIPGIDVNNIVKSITEDLYHLIENLNQTISKAPERLIAAINSASGNPSREVRQNLAVAIDCDIADASRKISDAMHNETTINEFKQVMGSVSGSLLTVIRETLTEVERTASDTLNRSLHVFKNASCEVIERVTEVINISVDDAAEKLKKASAFLNDGVKKLDQATHKATADATAAINSATNDAVSKIGSAVKDAAEKLDQATESLKHTTPPTSSGTAAGSGAHAVFTLTAMHMAIAGTVVVSAVVVIMYYQRYLHNKAMAARKADIEAAVSSALERQAAPEVTPEPVKVTKDNKALHKASCAATILSALALLGQYIFEWAFGGIPAVMTVVAALATTAASSKE